MKKTDTELREHVRNIGEDLEKISREELFTVSGDQDVHTFDVVLWELLESGDVWDDAVNTLLEHIEVDDDSEEQVKKIRRLVETGGITGLSTEDNELLVELANGHNWEEIKNALIEDELIEKVTIDQYFRDHLGVKFLVAFDGEYEGVEILVSYGGPNIYVCTTDSGCVEGYWGGVKEVYNFTGRVTDAIDDHFREVFSQVKATWK